jgi:hypothetical protein
MTDRNDVLEQMRRDGLSSERADAFRDSERAVTSWERDHPVDLADALDWIDALRALFGDPPVDRTPWQGDDFRL